MAMTFHGSGSVWFPERHSFLRFVGGEYIASDDAEIALLIAAGFRREYMPDKVNTESIPDKVEQEIIESAPERVTSKRGRPKNA